MSQKFFPKTTFDLHRILSNQSLVVTPDTLISEAITYLNQSCDFYLEIGEIKLGRECQKNCLIVLEENQVIGIITTRDLVKLAGNGISHNRLKVKDIMSSPVLTLTANSDVDLFQIIGLLQQHKIRHLPVVDGQGYYLGLITVGSLCKVLEPSYLLQFRQVKEVMTKEVIQVSPDTPLQSITQLMSQHKISCIVITEHQNLETIIPLGMITEQDIIQYQGLNLNFYQVMARDVITSPPVYLYPDQFLNQALALMDNYYLGRLLVINTQGHLQGIITESDILSALDSYHLYSVVEVLQKDVESLKSEQLYLLENHNQILEKEVQERTHDLQQKVVFETILSNLTLAIHQSFNLKDILETTTQELLTIFQVDRVLIYQLENTGEGEVITEACLPQWKSLLYERFSTEVFPPSCYQYYIDNKIGKIVNMTDKTSNPINQEHYLCLQKFLETYSIQSKLVVGILQDNNLWGLLILHDCQQARNWTHSEQNFLSQISTHLGIAIKQANLYSTIEKELQERQKIEASLQKERNFLSSILSVAGALVVVLDWQGRILRFNNCCEQLTKYQAQEVIGTYIWENLIPRNELNFVRDVFNHLSNGEYPSYYISHWQNKEGKKYLIQWANTVILDDQNEVEYIIATGTNITNQKRLENALEYIAVGVTDQKGHLFFESITNYLTVTLSLDYAIIAIPDTQKENTYKSLAFSHQGNLQEQIIYNIKHTPCENVIKQQIFCCYPDHVQLLFPYDEYLKKMEVQAYIGTPLLNSKNEVIGLMAILHNDSLPDSKILVEILKVFALRVGAEIEQQNIEKALRSSEETLVQLSENIHEVFFIREVNNQKVSYLSYAFEEIWGMKPQLVYDNPSLWFSVIHPEDCGNVRDIFTEEIKGKTTHIEYRIIRPDGQIRWINSRSFPIRDENEKVYRVVGTAQDITARKQAEIALKESQEKFLQLSENIHEVFFINEPNNQKIIYLNPAFEEIWGVKRELAYEDTSLWFNAIHPEDRSRVEAELKKEILGEVFEQEYRIIRPDGHLKWINAHSFPVRDEQGMVYRVVGTAQDITARKQAEIALQESEEKFRQLAENIHEVFFIQCIDTGKFLYLSPAFESISGYSCDALYENPDLWIEMIHPEDKPSILRELLHNNLEKPFTREYRIIRPNQEIRWLSSYGFPIQNTAGEFYRVVGIIEDITLKQKNEEALYYLNIQLENKVEKRTAELKQINEQLQQEMVEKERVSAELRDSEQRFRAIFEKVTVGICQVGLEGQLLRVNPCLCFLLRYDEEELLQLSFSEITHPDDLLEDSQLFESALRGEINSYNLEKRYICKDGSILWAYLNVTVVHNVSGSPKYFISVVQDIEDRKKTELALKQNQEFLRSILDTNPSLVFVKNHKEQFILANRAVAKFYGKDLSEVLNLSDTELNPKIEEVEHFREVDQKILAGECSEIIIEEKITDYQGNVHYFHTTKKPIFISETNDYGVLGVATDITLLKQGEYEIKRLASLVENCSDFIAFADANQRILFVNKAGRELIGIPNFDDNHPLFVKDFYSSEQYQFVQEEVLKRMIEKGEWRGELYMRNFETQQEIPFSANCFLIRDIQTDEVPSLACVARDITRQKQAEVELLKSLEKEKELNQLRSRFVTMTSHEFRTPLTTILGSAELLKYYGHSWDEGKKGKYLDRIFQTVKYMIVMLDNILLLGQVESEELQALSLTPFKVMELCESLVEELEVSYFRGKGYDRISLLITDQVVGRTFLLDEKIVRHILMNLMANALKYSPDTSLVTLRIDYQEGQLILKVQDQGIGIPPEDQPHLFDSFHRGHNVGKIQGTGLGLAIVKKAVERHGGSIDFESKLNQGTTFTVTLPCELSS